MKVIGAGFGRTGTMSMQAALKALGYRCYHMKEVPHQRGHLKMWHDFVSGRAPMDWQTLFKDYDATVDFPACVYYRELLREFPDAKVILNVREPDRWYDSFMTLRRTVDSFRIFRFIPKARRFIDFTDLLLSQVFDSSREREKCIAVFNKHNEEVRKNVPADRLLVFRVQEGWKPLCEFLGCDEPEGIAFPHLNEGKATVVEQAYKRFIGPWFGKAALATGAVGLLLLGWWLYAG